MFNVGFSQCLTCLIEQVFVGFTVFSCAFRRLCRLRRFEYAF